MWVAVISLLAGSAGSCATAGARPVGPGSSTAVSRERPPPLVDAGLAQPADFTDSDAAEERVLRRRSAEDTLERGEREWDQAVVLGRNTRAAACAAVKKMRFPVEGITQPVVVFVPAELADGGAAGEIEVVVLPDGTVQSCR